MSQEEQKSSRKHQFAPDTRHLQSLLNDTGMTHKDLGRHLGVADSSVSEWLRKGRAPRWTLLAVEGLRRRDRRLNSRGRVVLLRLTSKQWEVIEPMLQALGISMTEIGEEP